MVITQPPSPKYLGFEAQRFLASRLDHSYDLYGYFEDDLIIHDPGFSRKLTGFAPTQVTIVFFYLIALSLVGTQVMSIVFLLMVLWKNLICVLSFPILVPAWPRQAPVVQSILNHRRILIQVVLC